MKNKNAITAMSVYQFWQELLFDFDAVCVDEFFYGIDIKE